MAERKVLACLPPPQGIARAVVKGADAEAVESLLIDLERAADEKFGRELFDGVFDRLGGTLEARIAHRPLTGLARAGIKLGGSPVVERAHDAIKACRERQGQPRGQHE